jgi:ribosomal protein S17E
MNPGMVGKFKSFIKSTAKRIVDKFKNKMKLMKMMGNKLIWEEIYNDIYINFLLFKNK